MPDQNHSEPTTEQNETNEELLKRNAERKQKVTEAIDYVLRKNDELYRRLAQGPREKEREE